MRLIKGIENGVGSHKGFPCLNKKCFYSCFSWMEFDVVYENCLYEVKCPCCGSEYIYDSFKNENISFKARYEKKDLIAQE
jgi:hypothetical protein